jgi:hypothetical protein
VPRITLRERLFAIDGRSLAVFRIGLGATVIVDLLTRAGALAQHYTDGGVLPRAAVARLFLLSDWHWSIHLWTGSVAGQAALFVLAGLIAGALIVGYRTRLATVLTWALLISLQARNPMVLYGADQLLRLLLFWSMFLPLGSVWSLDRRRRSGPGEVRCVSVASAALLLQPCVMYVFSGLLKQNPAWESGTAILAALSAETYATPLGRELLRFPALLTALGHAVPWIELLAPVALFVPWATTAFRAAGLLVLVAFHAGIAAVLVTGLFPLIALTGLLPFIPGAAWDRLRTIVRAGRDGDEPRVAPTRRAAARRPPATSWRSTARAGLVAGLLAYTLVWNVAGLRIEEYTAAQSLAWYREWWAADRTGVPLTFRDYSVERRLGVLGWIGRVAGLQQRWDMFHRVGPEIRGWPLVVGTFGDGRRVSVLDGGRPFDEAFATPPGTALAAYPGARWLVYFTYLRTPGTRPARELLPAVVTRDWSRHHPGSELATLQMLFVQPTTTPDGASSLDGEVWYDGPASGPVTDAARPAR